MPFLSTTPFMVKDNMISLSLNTTVISHNFNALVENNAPAQIVMEIVLENVITGAETVLKSTVAGDLPSSGEAWYGETDSPVVNLSSFMNEKVRIKARFPVQGSFLSLPVYTSILESSAEGKTAHEKPGGVAGGGVMPSRFALHSNYPNPFNPVTKIVFDLPKSGEVTLQVFDIHGKLVAEPVRGKYAAGSYTVEFDGSTFSSGVYFCEFIAGNFRQVRKMMLVK